VFDHQRPYLRRRSVTCLDSEESCSPGIDAIGPVFNQAQSEAWAMTCRRTAGCVSFWTELQCVGGCGLLIGSPIQEIEKEAERIAGMNLEGKTVVAALHLRCSRKRMTRVKKRHIVEALASEQYLSLQQEIESRTDSASPLHPEPSHQRSMPTCTSHFDNRQQSRKDWIRVPLKIGRRAYPNPCQILSSSIFPRVS
jgi:hypothetical protein